MAEHDRAVGDAERPRCVDIFEVARAQEFRPHHADKGDPREQEHDAEQDEEARRQHGGDDEDQVEHRDRRPDLDHALEDQVGPAAEIALHSAGRHADDGRGQREHEPEQDRYAEAVDDAREHVAGLVVGAEPVPVADRAGGVCGTAEITAAARLRVIEP